MLTPLYKTGSMALTVVNSICMGVTSVVTAVLANELSCLGIAALGLYLLLIRG